ncbi:MAG: LysR substrate-binding domain-containing protein [Candidatus Pelagadaptatus aseana]|uniref:LysR family transcriptional regulator n=1 Tax=Candidatus Pelagadaptatus aseana TaxID=3120508 RepID=UPI0039B19575
MSKSPITIEVLETMDAIDRRGSFAKAAEELNKATSAVSYTVQKLEEQLDITLFQRQGRRSVMTPAGRLMLDEGREILKTTARLASKAREVATGWEPRISIGIESLLDYNRFFNVIQDFLKAHPSIELDIRECVLNGGWELLEQNQVDLVLGSPGPVPQQKGYRALQIEPGDLVAVIASKHEMASQLQDGQTLQHQLGSVRRVISHDTSISDIPRSAGFSNEGKTFYLQNMDQKVAAIMAGIGAGHLPRHRIQSQLNSGELIALGEQQAPQPEQYLAWKISNKGRGLHQLSQQLTTAFCNSTQD